MATITYEGYCGTPGWEDLAGNRLVFSNSLTDISSSISANSFQDGTHLGSGTPGTDQCGATHLRNVKFLTETTMSVNGAASETINDTNLADTECTFRIHFNDAAGYALQNIKIYAFDGSDSTTPAVGVDAAIYVKGASMTGWETLNSDSISGSSAAGMSFTTAGIGGEVNALEIPDRSANTDHYIYCALSVSPESAGAKGSFALGTYIEYY